MYKRVFEALHSRRMLNWISDKAFLKMAFYCRMNKKLNLRRPQSFNEKLQWLKLYERRPEYSMMVDKYAVRKYIADQLGEEYLIPLIGVWDSADEIDFNELPNSFVLKCNHNSGLGMFICKDKLALNEDVKKRIRVNLNKGLKRNYYLTGREWPYKNVKPRIIGEQYMDSDGDDLPDYKIHCFNGIPRFILVCRNRFGNVEMTEDFFDTDWNHLDIKRPEHPNSTTKIERPEVLKELLDLSKKLSSGIPFLRVDFYVVNGRIFFGELTFFPASGFDIFEPEEWDSIIGNWLELPVKI